MIKLNTKLLKPSKQAVNDLFQQSMFAKVKYSIVNLFRNVVGLPDKMSRSQKFVSDLEEVEKLIKQAIYLTANKHLEKLRLQTPFLTGATREGWGLQIKQEGDTLVLEYDNTNRDLIHILNYGTRGRFIHARKAKAMHFKVGGKDVFAKVVWHPDVAGLGFLEKAEAELNDDLTRLKNLPGLSKYVN